MKRLFSCTFVLSLVAFASVDAKPARPLYEPEEWREHLDLAGTYDLYRNANQTGPSGARMKIWAQQGNQFSIGIAEPTRSGAVDWEGHGTINGNQGHYDWVFPDGKRGRTTFIIDVDGNLHGQVRGSGIDWDYVARRIGKPVQAPKR
jgi:hypothetical protein